MLSSSPTLVDTTPDAPPARDTPVLSEPARDVEPLAGSPAGLRELAGMVSELTSVAADELIAHPGPLPACSPAELAHQVQVDLAELTSGQPPAAAAPGDPAAAPRSLLPPHGAGTGAVRELVRRYAQGSVQLSHPATAAHLQPPALTVAAAADLLASAFNASVDTWDSGPYASELERHVIAALLDLIGHPTTGSGVLTSGGSGSNLHALLLARDRAARVRFGTDTGWPAWPAACRPVVFCSEAAHFSTARACAVLGLGRAAVRTVPVDERYRMRADALDAALSALPPDTVPVAVVATAGTTDFGSIDPLPACREIAHRHRAWLHVDAAYGGGALFSDRLRPLLSGVDGADSVTLDLHKVGWQPASASALLVRRHADLVPQRERVAYLNPEDDGRAGYDGLLERSLATTRRADALKIAATFLAYGRHGLGKMLDSCHDLARHAERWIAAHPRLELTSGATLTTVVFRYRTPDPGRCGQINAALRRRLMRSGTALIGRTDVPGRGTQLKLTMLNPAARRIDVDRLLDAVLAAGDREVAEA